jgi:H/ACA ribonucleoprotein complex subunit 4
MVNIQKIKQNKSIQELLEFGIINIDKSSGPTSFNVSEFVKKSLNLRKTSHFGTLDPKVTGVLPVALNRACKLTGHFLGEDKTYIGIARFHKEVSLKELEKTIQENFLGEILQTPPLKSRVKRQERPRTIYEFKILENQGKDFLFKAKVQGGTYIRKLIDDLGKKLGCGAHMLELRRIQAGIFDEFSMISLYDFEKAVEEYKRGNEEFLRKIIIPAEIISELYPSIEIKKDCVKRIFHGSPIHEDELKNKEYLNFEKDQRLIVFSEERFIGVFRVIKQGNLFARSEFTMQPIK